MAPKTQLTRSALIYGGVTVLLCACSLVAALLLGRNVPTSLDRVNTKPQPIAAMVTPARDTYTHPAQLTVEFADPPPVVSTAESGLITKVNIQPGEQLSPGDLVFRINGVGVMAYAGETVFYRALTRGDTGPDVAGLQTALNQILDGPPLATDGKFGLRTETRVEKLQRALGVEEPDGVFEPQYLLRIPSNPYPVAENKIAEGREVPSVGESVLLGAWTISNAIVQPAPGFQGPEGDYLFRVSGKEIAATLNSGQWTITDVEALAAVSSKPVEANRLVHEGQLVSLVEEEQLAVPAAAIIADPRSRAGTANNAASAENICVALADATHTKVPVEIVGVSADGRPYIRGQITAGTQILLNPGEVLPDLSCP
ncbi:Uncharacterised protein [Actinobaculum suis]|uniref:Peptidoglycan binding-like domain-containing protein n=1 Tax=Actinobaculum suis TaxID=1657 RepID=A0A7Z8Y8U3_9ACTO|nr:peptidoglycan-binding protein [Actinobaculum suis]VDG76419.1 Uncharacterised protein [Actinobaculum suis]